MRSSLAHPAEELSQSFTLAWDSYYSHFFSWVVKPLFKYSPSSPFLNYLLLTIDACVCRLLIKACPSREALWDKLGPREEAAQAAGVWLGALDERLVLLERFFVESGFGVL